MGVTQLTLQYTSHLKELISVPKKSESMSLMQEPSGNNHSVYLRAVINSPVSDNSLYMSTEEIPQIQLSM